MTIRGTLYHNISLQAQRVCTINLEFVTLNLFQNIPINLSYEFWYGYILIFFLMPYSFFHYAQTDTIPKYMRMRIIKPHTVIFYDISNDKQSVKLYFRGIRI